VYEEQCLCKDFGKKKICMEEAVNGELFMYDADLLFPIQVWWLAAGYLLLLWCVTLAG